MGQAIDVQLQAEGGTAKVVVANVAPAIPEEVSGDLFAAYKRGRDAARTNRTGLGLGLYITSRIAAEHGGTLAYRHDGVRVLFELQLPATDLAAQG
jgi:signal transduction histidine kinase